MLEWLCRRRALQRRLFPRQLAVVRESLSLLGRGGDDEHAMRQRLRVDLWWRWRAAALARCPRAEFER